MTATGRARGNWLAVCLLGAGHGVGDFNAGVLLAGLGHFSGSDLVIIYLLYNAFAFAGQPFAGVICDKVGRTMAWYYGGGVLSAASLLVAGGRPELAVVCAGLASAFYHSAGGAAAWRLGGQRALAAGIFAAPGVVGLAIGMAVGGRLSFAQSLGGGVAMIGVLGLLWALRPKLEGEAEGEGRRAVIDRGLLGGVVGWLVVIAIAARSFAWSMGQEAIFPPEDAVWLALAAAVGKCVAGILADRWTAGGVTVGALLIAAGCLAIGRNSPLWFFPAVTALQAATAPMMALVFRAWPRHPAFGSGLAQGLAVAVGGAPLIVLSRLGEFPFLAGITALVFAAGVVVFVNGRRGAKAGT